MIDWLGVAAGALWISGCAVALTTLSIAHWQAAVCARSLRVVLARAHWQTAFYLAGALFCAGWAIYPDWSWEQWLWAALALLFVRQAWSTERRAERQRRTDT